MFTRCALAAALVTAGGLLLTGPAAAAGEPDRARLRVVASGLDNPRGVAVGPAGEIYVAEAGHGGSAPCRPGAAGELRCFGSSGAITVIEDGRQRRILRNLPSLALPSGADAAGPADVAVGPGGEVHHVTSVQGGVPHHVTAGAGGVLPDVPAGAGTGLSARQGPATAGDRATVLRSYDKGVGVMATERGLVVADAAVGALLRVGIKGRAQVVARIAEPTAVARGPDGAFYVSERRRIWRVEPGRAARVHAGGFVGVVDLAWSPRGLLVLESSGELVVSGAEGRRRIATGLTAPGGLAVRDRHAFVTTCANCRSTGEVVRVPL